MKELSLIEKLFSIINEENYKVIRLFGFKYKIDRRPAFKKKYGDLPLENKIVFSNFHGNGYGCNPKYIAQQILNEGLPYELVWLVKEPDTLRNQFPPEIRLVEYTSEAAMKELATAKIWVNNQRLLYHIRKGLTKRPQQCYILWE